MKNNYSRNLVEFWQEDANEREHRVEVEFEITVEWNDFEKDLDQFNILAVSVDGELIDPSEWSQFENEVFDHSDAWHPVEECTV